MSITVLHDRPQADGTRWTVYVISLAEGHSAEIGPTRVPAGVTAEDHAPVMLARWEQRLRDQELDKLAAGVVAGKVDPKTHVPLLNSSVAFQAELVRRLFNAMRDADTDSNKFDTIRATFPLAAAFTDAEVAALTGWVEADVADARSRLAAIHAAMVGLDHGKGEL